MRAILVTGANKGIGFAIAKGVVAEHGDTVLLLGARDRGLGEAARQVMVDGDPGLGPRVRVLELDVGSDGSVTAAVTGVPELLGEGERLYGVVNNAGIGDGTLADVLNVNVRGVHRVCEGVLPLLQPAGGRIVNVTSASAPNFVSDCSEEMRRFFLDGNTQWGDLDALMQEALGMEGDAGAFARRGLDGGAAYGLSKALTNTYTLQLARRVPKLVVNACTPGYIATDMTRGRGLSQGKTPAQMGMKTPAQGARSALHLLFGELAGSGHYYGSDCQRSPMDRYRAPGDPPYTGE